MKLKNVDVDVPPGNECFCGKVKCDFFDLIKGCKIFNVKPKVNTGAGSFEKVDECKRKCGMI